RARANGVHDLRRIDAGEVRELEPALGPCAAALLSPSSGIVDSHGLMTALLGDAENAGALLALRTPFESARREGGLWRVRTGGEAPFELATRCLVNAAGLSAQAVAAAIEGFARAAIPPLFRAKGNYFALAAKAPFSHLIYPTPVDGGLGVHLTLDLGGQARFGPDVQWLAEGEAIDYAVDPGRRAAFAEAIRRYWPGLPEQALEPAYSGVRPKLAGRGAAAADFVIQGPAEHGVPGLVQLFGIESPGLTASLAIAQVVRSRLDGGPAGAA
ncbi:MAG: FAD-dependent oxidoreductase, partial [Burkholderiales bacterium]|nr:FAD-dependent oxidoreductase [Burkholderiales bacterium]